MRRSFVLLFFLFSAALLLRAQKHFTYTPQAKEAYELALSLRFEEAGERLSKIKSDDPENLIIYHIENYIDFFRIYINEDEAEFEKLEKNKNRRLEAIAKGDRNSPYYLFLQADIRLHWALVRVKFEEYFLAFREVSKAYKLLEKNQKRFPDFMPNLKDLGILHALVGTIPENYHWGIKLLSGMEGSIDQGRSEIEQALAYAQKNDFIFDTETLVLYAFLRLHLDNEGDDAWDLLRLDGLEPEKNPLHCFVVANIAMRTNRNDEAIRVLKQKPDGKAYLPFPYLEFMLGTAKLRKLDNNAAKHFHLFLKQYKGRHFIKEAYQKLAWTELIQSRPSGYKKYMDLCLKKGKAIAGGDKNALKEAKSATLPPEELVQARLLFDGAYFEKAYRILKDLNPGKYKDARFKLEYTYRLGRILHGMKNDDEAVNYYKQTINEGKRAPYFFACNAALMAGQIFEERGDKDKAVEYYRLCLSIKPDDYRTALHQKAKAGLARVE